MPVFNGTKTRTWDRTTPNDGLLLESEFNRLYENDAVLLADKVDKVLDLELIEVNSIPLGMPFPQWFEGNASAVVAKYPSRFIKLSKDLHDGVGEYNYNKLGSQAANTANETTFYTATIVDVTSPLNTLSVTLINSTENTTGGVTSQPSFLGAGESAQSRLVNQLQGHKINIISGQGSIGVALTNSGSDLGTWNFSNITIISDGTNGTPRLGKTTRPDTVTAVYYMRIK